MVEENPPKPGCEFDEPNVVVFVLRLPNVFPPAFWPPSEPKVGALFDAPIAPKVEEVDPPKTGAVPKDVAPPNAGAEPKAGPPPNAGAAAVVLPVGEHPNFGADPNECIPVLAGVDAAWLIPNP